MAIKCPKCHSDNPDTSRFCAGCGTKLSPPDEISISQTKTIRKPPGELLIGSTFAGKYKIIEELGRGGMGVVYKAEDTKLKRTVALKFLPPELAHISEVKERFMREAQAAAALDHPKICTVYEVDEAEGKTFISMAYVEGQSLRERIEQGPLDTDEALDIAIQVSEGLEEAHKKGIIHRDIKSANIMVTEKAQAKIMDFGLAKVRGGTLVTKEGTTMGTVAYMSPEQARGETVDHRTDIWSLGVVLYEMLSGQLPFKGDREASIMYSIVHEEQKPIKDIKPDIPIELQKIVNRALKKKVESRYFFSTEISKDLKQYQTLLKAPYVGITDLKSFLRRVRKPRIAVPTILIILALCLTAVWFFSRSAKIGWARKKAIAEIIQLAEEENYLAGFKLARKVQKIIPEDQMLTRLWPQVSEEFSLQTVPPGADLYVRDTKEPGGNWEYLGQISEESIRVPKGNYEAKLEKEGCEKFEFLLLTEHLWNFEFKLSKVGSVPPRMTIVRGGPDIAWLSLYNYDSLSSVNLGEYLIDKYEVTNREFKEFVDKDGYQKPEYWKHEFEKDGRILAWEEAMETFRDKTGRPGPSTWEFGTYLEGQADYPVTGVSWYEAAAYAEFADKCLPTIYHWDRAANLWFSGVILPGSNFGSSSLSPVGSYRGSLGRGTYDMAGNAREWSLNATEDMRFILGGAWSDPPYFFTEPNVKPPFDRSPGNGFRCMKLMSAASTSEEVERPLARVPGIDWSKEKPFSDDVFNTWLSFISYPKLDLNPVVELVDDTQRHWRIEKISFDAAYDKERILAYLFLPKNATPPFQTIIYWPGANAAWLTDSRNSDAIDKTFWDYFVKDGRAVMFPILKGTFERGGDPSKDFALMIAEILFDKDLNIKQMKDIKRCCDYLESRKDIDREKLAFCGMSWGAHMGSFPCSAEKRLKAGIFISGCVFTPEIVGWAHRVKIPVLMINGRYDVTFPYKETQLPLFRALGASSEHKRHVLFDTDHLLSGYMNEVIKVNLEWLDKYLGPVN